MIRHPLHPCAALTALLALLPAQEREPGAVDNDLGARLLIRGGLASVQVNDAMIGSLLGGADLVALLRQQHGDLVRDCRLGNTWMGGGHGDGVREIGIGLVLTTSPEPTRAQFASMRKAIVDQLRQQLTEVLFELPRRELEQEAAELQHRLRQLALEHSQRPLEDLGAIQSSLQQQRQNLLAQQAEVRVTLATESKVRDHLHHQRDRHRIELAELVARRNALREHTRKLEDEIDRLRAQIAALGNQPDEARKALPALVTNLGEIEAEHREVAREAERREGALSELHRISAHLFEQLPAVELLLVRTEARRQSLADEAARLDRATAELRKRQQEAAREAAESELLRLQVDVTRERLAEVQAQLARLRPVHVDLLTGN